jgi:hypothetical protein
MPAKNPPAKKKNSEDYVGPYDSDTKPWMTRTQTDKGGNRRSKPVPQSSNPSEANDYFEGFDRKKYNSQVTPGKWTRNGK